MSFLTDTVSPLSKKDILKNNSVNIQNLSKKIKKLAKCSNSFTINVASNCISVDTKRLLRDVNKPETIINILEPFGAEFEEYYGNYTSKKPKVIISQKSDTGDWVVARFSASSDIPTGGVKDLMRVLHGGHFKNNKSAYIDYYKKLAAFANLNFNHYVSNSTTTYQTLDLKKTLPTVIDKPLFVPNKERTIRKSYDYKLASWATPIGYELLNYFDGKINAGGEKHKLQSFLQSFGVAPVCWKKYKGNNKELHSLPPVIGSDINPMFTLVAGENIKVVRLKAPNKNRQEYGHKDYGRPTIKRAYSLQSCGNYVFGFDQLPATGKKLIITGGESDCLAVNYHYNKDDVYAICLNSENCGINSQLVSELKRRFESVVICYDNDKTGITGSKDIAKKHGIPRIDLQKFTDENDICDVMTCGDEWAKWNLDLAIIEPYKAIGSYDKLFSIPVSCASLLSVERYIGDSEIKTAFDGRLSAFDALMFHLVHNDRSILKARAGMGKTWALMKAAISDSFFKVMGVRQVIFCVPTVAIASQVASDFKSDFDIDVPCIIEGASIVDIETAIASNIVVATYDSLHKVGLHMENALLIVDEFHQLRNDEGFRKDACVSVSECMRAAKKVLAISATPLREFATLEGYKMIVAESKKVQNHNLQTVVYNGNKEYVLRDLAKRVDLGTGNHIIKLNDVGRLEAMKALLQDLHPAQVVTIVSSKESKYRQGNEIYKSIIDNGMLPQGTKSAVILTTSLMEAGVSLKFPVESVTLIDSDCEDGLIQFISRPRMHGVGEALINDKVKVLAYHREKKEVNFDVNKSKSTIDYIEKSLCDTEKLTEMMNNKQGDSVIIESLRVHLDSTGFVYWSELSESWEVNKLRIYRAANERKNKLMTIRQRYDKIAAENDHINVLPFLEVTLEKDDEMCKHLKEVNKISKDDKLRASDVMLDEKFEFSSIDEDGNKVSRSAKGIDFMMGVTLATTSNSDLRKDIAEAQKMKNGKLVFDKVVDGKRFKRDDDYKATIIDAMGVNSLRSFEAPVERYMKLYGLGVPIDKIADLVVDNNTQRAFDILSNQIIIQKELKQHRYDRSKLDGRSIVRVLNAKKIIKVMPRNVGERVFTPEKLRKLVCRAFDTWTTKENQALMRVQELYDVQMLKVRGVKHYLVGKRLSVCPDMKELIKLNG